MNRKDFLQKGLLGTAILSNIALSDNNISKLTKERIDQKFKLNFAPTFGMFQNLGGEDLLDQLNFIAEAGFKGLTDDGLRNRDIDLQEKISKRLEKLGLRMGVFGAHRYYWSEPNLASGDEDYREEFLEDIKSSVEVAKRINGKWLTVMPGALDMRLEMGYQTANVIETLKRACEILEPHNLTIVIEPVNRRWPGLFLTTIPQAYAICRAIDSPACKILNDLYHQQVTEGNLIPNLDQAWNEIAYIQVGDNPGRMEPFSGEINFQNIFKHLYDKGYQGLIGMEHGKTGEGKEGERAVIDAYIKANDY